jgi:hypothetical protein
MRDEPMLNSDAVREVKRLLRSVIAQRFFRP